MKSPSAAAAIRWTLVSGAVFLALFFLPRSPLFPRTNWGPVLHEETSTYSHIRIRGDERLRRMLFVTEKGAEQLQSEVDLAAPGELQVAYTEALFASFLVKHPQRRVLIVGLGGGGMVRFLQEHFPDTRVDVVEIDPVVVRLAEEWFGTKSGGNTTIHTADAFEFLPAVEEETYDVIYLDAFLRPGIDADTAQGAARLKTVAFLETVRDRLVPDGVLACNLISYRDTTPGDLEALAEVFPTVERFAVPGTGNLVVLACRQEFSKSEDEWRQLANRREGDTNSLLPFTKFVDQRIVETSTP